MSTNQLTSRVLEETPVFGVLDRPLKKHAAIVHSEGKLTALQRKAVNVLLAQAYDNLLSRREHSISVSALSLLIDFNSNNTAFLKEALRSLQSTTVEFNLLNNAGKERWVSSPVVGHLEIEDGVITYQWVERMAALLFDPDRYAQIHLRVQRKIKGDYALALYENCARFRQEGKRVSTGMWPVDKWRRLLGAEGVSYSEYKEFKRTLLKDAIAEVNKRSDIFITQDTERDPKDKRRVIAIGFWVESNPNYDHNQGSLTGGFIPQDDQDIRESLAFAQLKKHGIADRLAIQTIRQDPELALAIVRDAEAKDKQGKIKVSTGAYIAGMIERGADPRPSNYDAEREKETKQTSEIAEQKVKAEKQAELRNEFSRIATTRRINMLTPEERRSHSLEWLATDGQGRADTYDSATGKFSNTLDNTRFSAYLRIKLGKLATDEEFAEWLANRKG